MRLFEILVINTIFVKVLFESCCKDKCLIRYYAIHNTLNFVKIWINGF